MGSYGRILTYACATPSPGCTSYPTVDNYDKSQAFSCSMCNAAFGVLVYCRLKCNYYRKIPLQRLVILNIVIGTLVRDFLHHNAKHYALMPLHPRFVVFAMME